MTIRPDGTVVCDRDGQTEDSDSVWYFATLSDAVAETNEARVLHFCRRNGCADAVLAAGKVSAAGFIETVRAAQEQEARERGEMSQADLEKQAEEQAQIQQEKREQEAQEAQNDGSTESGTSAVDGVPGSDDQSSAADGGGSAQPAG